jgi:hypothetical protein
MTRWTVIFEELSDAIKEFAGKPTHTEHSV